MLTPEVKQLFPLRSPGDIVQLFRKQLDGNPDLTLLSIVIGYIENQLTSQESPKLSFPVIEWSLVEDLYKKFQTILSSVESLKPSLSLKNNKASREVIKRVSEIIWNSLIRSTFKDRAHLQSLYSYLTSSKLDCFGVAFAVVAGCQLLGCQGVNLAISEDHAWVVKSTEGGRLDTIEVTWHGKGFEDKRGESVSVGVESQSWLYLSGHSVNCDRFMEVSALILSMNPSLNLTSACLEMTNLQQQLLWLLYDNGHLQKYPMALGSLGELEEFSPSPVEAKRISSLELYNQAVVSARKWYSDAHVYPYVAIGNYYYRKTMYKESFAAWANAGDVIRRYIYSKDDEEVYKELVDIANEQIPSIMKTESSGHSANSILRDPNCFSRLLRFYDGICKWEEGSVTPILHIGWAKPLVSTIGKFDFEIRSQVIIETAADDEAIPTPTYSPNDATTDGTPPTPTLAALTAACGEKLLNPNFLTGGELQPFRESKSDGDQTRNINSDPTTTSGVVVESERDAKEEQPAAAVDADVPPARPVIKLYSQKMKGLRNLLVAEKLNFQAILLQVTAQSQVGGGKKSSRGGNSNDPSGSLAAAGDKAATADKTGGTHKEHSNTNQNVTSGSGNSGSASGEGGGGTVGRPKRPRRE